MQNYKFIGTTLVAGMILSACQANKAVTPDAKVGLQPSQPVASKEATLNGRWLPKNEEARKIYYNDFRDGKFVSKSPDGATTIAAGQYKISETGEISMSWYSEARKANSSASCQSITANELQCTSNGAVFNLVRT